MNTDIIALATKCGFSTVEDRTIYLSKYSKEKLHDCILKLATLLEAEIRKEFEARITDLEDALDHIKKIAGMARVPTKRLDWIEARASMALLNEPWDKDYKPLPKNANSSRNTVRHLTAQNTKLMEALEVILDSGLLVVSTELHDKVLKQTYSAIHSNITPQPENEGKE